MVDPVVAEAAEEEVRERIVAWPGEKPGRAAQPDRRVRRAAAACRCRTSPCVRAYHAPADAVAVERRPTTAPFLVVDAAERRRGCCGPAASPRARTAGRRRPRRSGTAAAGRGSPANSRRSRARGAAARRRAACGGTRPDACSPCGWSSSGRRDRRSPRRSRSRARASRSAGSPPAGARRSSDGERRRRAVRTRSDSSGSTAADRRSWRARRPRPCPCSPGRPGRSTRAAARRRGLYVPVDERASRRCRRRRGADHPGLQHGMLLDQPLAEEGDRADVLERLRRRCASATNPSPE